MKLTDPLRNLPLKEQLLAKAIAVEIVDLVAATEHAREEREISMFGHCPICRVTVNPEPERPIRNLDEDDIGPHLPSCPHGIAS